MSGDYAENTRILTDHLYLFFAKVAAVSAGEWYLVTRVFQDSVPAWLLNHAVAFCFLSTFLTLTIYNMVIYPNYISPLRFLPKVNAGSFTIILESPRGKTPLKWFRQNPTADLFSLRGGAVTLLVAASATALKDILNTRTYDFEKPWGIRVFLARVIGFGLILSEGGAHKKQRKALTPAFNIKKIRELYSFMWQKTGVLLEELNKDIAANPAGDGFGKIEIAEWGSRLTLDIIGPTAIGRDFNSMRTEENKVAEAFLEILDPNTERLVFFGLQNFFHSWFLNALPISINRMLDRNQNFLRGLCKEIIGENKQRLAKQGQDGAKEFEILADIIQSGEFTDEELIDQMLTFLAAGHETTASALTWCSYMMAKNPDVQEKLRAEIRERIPSSSSPITWDLLESMPYLNGVCEETLRLYPTVPTTIREAVRETTVAGVTIPKYTIILLVPYAINRHPTFWGPEADKLKPERWIDSAPDGSQKVNKHGGASTNFAEITFLHGPRACIGRDFAKAELRCAIAGVVGKFLIEMQDPKHEPKVTGVVTTKPEGGMKLKLKELPGW